jgi:radical SAM superfamily enzyme YgiQ (UPF0313 family)
MKREPVVCLLAPPNCAMTDPRIAPPVGLMNLVAWARKYGFDTSRWRIVDLNVECLGPWPAKGHWTHDFSIERCMSLLPTGADIYGLSLASMQLPHGRALAAALRVREPNAVLICGGSHASAAPQECAVEDEPGAANGFDYVVEREGEHAFLGILHRWQAGDLPQRPESGEVIRGAPVDPLEDLPFPARDMLDFSRYTRMIAGEPATNLISARGCPARCVFCQQEALWGSGAIRSQSSARILAEIDDIYATTGIRHILFLDDSLTARKRSEMHALCDGLQERGVKWRGWTRANLCVRPGDRELLAHMGATGCQAICIGVEAGSDKVLKAMDKGTSVAVNRQAIRNVAEAGIRCRVSIMVGNPRETWDDVLALVDFIEEMGPWVEDWILSSFVPLPGTPAWDHPEKFGMVIDKIKARAERYRHFFVVGGDERSGQVHSYVDGTGPEDIQRRHAWVQESLLRLAPRNRLIVTAGVGAQPSA